MLVAVLFGAGSTARAEPGGFTVQELSVAHPVRQSVFSVETSPGGDRSLVAAGVDDAGKGWMSVYPVDEDGVQGPKAERTLALPDDVIALDSDGRALYALTPDGIARWQPGSNQFELVAKATSLFQLRPRHLVPFSFLSDVDGDEDLDVVLPDFRGVRLFLHQADGSFTKGPILDVPAIAHHQEYNRRITYRPVRLYFLDADGDGVRDAAAVRGGIMLFFAGTGPGAYAPGKEIPLGLGITERFLGDDVGGVDVDHTDQTWKRVVAVADFDGSGRADLFTHTVESQGLFDKSHVLQLHAGKNGKGFSFGNETGDRIDTNVVLDTPVFEDVNGDGRMDFGTYSVDFGVGTIFNWLVSGTIDLEVAYYALGEDGRYGAEPSRREEVEVAFDLSSGKPTVPPWLLADVDGDGRKDLVLGEDDSKLQVFLGNGSAELFAETPVVTETRLPGNGRDLVSALDVNADGKTDVVLRYGKVDGENLDGTMRVLVAQ